MSETKPLSSLEEITILREGLAELLKDENIRHISRDIKLDGYVLQSAAYVCCNLAVIVSPDDHQLRMAAAISAGVFALWSIGKFVYSEYYSWREKQSC